MAPKKGKKTGKTKPQVMVCSIPPPIPLLSSSYPQKPSLHKIPSISNTISNTIADNAQLPVSKQLETTPAQPTTLPNKYFCCCYIIIGKRRIRLHNILGWHS
jgi:hypothetical protein